MAWQLCRVTVWMSEESFGKQWHLHGEFWQMWIGSVVRQMLRYGGFWIGS